jgi:UDP-3-O-[3-hydroxymyristoyl] glucosamine N-acyltransferase
MPALSVAQLAELCGGQIEGDPQRMIATANTLEDASEQDLAYAANPKAFEAASESHAGCVIVPPSFDVEGGWSLIRVQNPRSAFVQAVRALYATARQSNFIHPSAVIAPTASVDASCFIGPYVSIGEHSHIAPGCVIGNGTTIGRRVSIGTDATVHANVTIYDDVRVGHRVILHAGCVLGADGFGFTLAEGRYEKFPQVGGVEIGDDVEIGANCCVDRAALGVTRIGRGTKLDNLIHVAHNCKIGEHVVIAAQTGFSGSVTVGDYAVIGGQAGIGEKANIASKAVVGGKAGVLTSQKVHAGEPVWGIPARPLRQHLKGLAHVTKLPELREEVRELRQEIEKLSKTRRFEAQN